MDILRPPHRPGDVTGRAGFLLTRLLLPLMMVGEPAPKRLLLWPASDLILMMSC